MARGKKTPFKVEDAIWILHKHFGPGEIAKLLKIPHRTINDKLVKLKARAHAAEEARQRAEAEEAARIEQERLDRERWEAETLAKLIQKQERFAKPVGLFKGRRFSS